jgi:hypothetical protein
MCRGEYMRRGMECASGRVSVSRKRKCATCQDSLATRRPPCISKRRFDQPWHLASMNAGMF